MDENTNNTPTVAKMTGAPPINNMNTNTGSSSKKWIWTIVVVVVLAAIIILIATSGGDKTTINTNNQNQENTNLPDTNQAQYNGLATSDDDFSALDDALDQL